MMRILAVTSEIPYPPNGARRVRGWRLLSYLAQHAEVTLLTWGDGDRARSEAVKSVFAGVIELPLREEQPSFTTRLARQVAFVGGSSVPPYGRAFLKERSLHTRGRRRDFAEMVRQTVQDGGIEAITLEEEVLSCLSLRSLPIPIVQHRLNLIAPTAAVIRRSASSPLKRWFPDNKSWRRYDRKVQANADLVVAVTEPVGQAVLRISPTSDVRLVCSGVEKRPLANPPSSGRDVAFIGQMDQGANIDAVRWFVDDIWAPLEPELPGSTLRIVGRNPASSVLALQGPRVVVTGEVHDITQACEGARVGVVPLRAGMGIKDKTLELLALGLPVVATHVGCEGIAASADDGLLMVDDASEFVEKLRWLMSDDRAVDRLGAAACAFAQRELGWDRPQAEYHRILTDLVSRWTRPQAGAQEAGIAPSPAHLGGAR